MTPTITNNTAKHRLEADLGGATALLEYVLSPEKVTFTHTEVPPEFEAQGIGTRLVEAGVEFARSEGLKVVPRCPFVAAIFRRRNQEYGDLLAS